MGTKRHHSSRESSKKGKKSNGHSSSHTKAKKKAHSSRKNSGIMNHQKVVINQQFHSGNSAGIADLSFQSFPFSLDGFPLLDGFFGF